MFDPIIALKNGDCIQQRVYHSIMNSNILSCLDKYHPQVVGTFPIGIYLASSDIDIVCQVEDIETFVKEVSSNFRISNYYINNDIVVINLFIDSFEYELYGTNIATKEQNAYRHMIIEEQILQLMPTVFKEEIIALKKAGLKTEPAFCQLLGLEGNPYDALLQVDVDKLTNN